MTQRKYRRTDGTKLDEARAEFTRKTAHLSEAELAAEVDRIVYQVRKKPLVLTMRLGVVYQNSATVTVIG